MGPMAKSLFIFFILITCTVYANVFKKDDRVSIRAVEKTPLAAIGTLTNFKTLGRGTAFLVSPCLLLSNFHVALGKTKDFNEHQTSVFQLPGRDGENAEVVTHGDYFLEGESFVIFEDWALLQLTKCLGNSVGWLSLKSISSLPFVRMNVPILLAGFPNDKITDLVTYDYNCEIKDLDWSHDCATRAGNSGSPLIVSTLEDNIEEHHVVAIHSTAQGEFSEVIKYYTWYMGNRALPVSGFMARVQPYIDADIKKNATK